MSSQHSDSAMSDPLFRALANGNEACPDGKSLANLGRLIRNETRPQKVDLREHIQKRLPELSEEDLIEDFYAGDSQAKVLDPELTRLSNLVKEVGSVPHTPQLQARVQRKLRREHHSQKLGAPIDGATRWRIWSAVAAAHVAALFIAAVVMEQWFGEEALKIVENPVETASQQMHPLEEQMYRQRMPGEKEQSIHRQWPVHWFDGATRQSIFVLREEESLRKQAELFYGISGTELTRKALLSYLNSDEVLHAVNANSEYAFAAQSARLLAQLGEKAAQIEEYNELVYRCLQSEAARLVDFSSFSPLSYGLLTLSLAEASVALDHHEAGAFADVLIKSVNSQQAANYYFILASNIRLLTAADQKIDQELEKQFSSEDEEAQMLNAHLRGGRNQVAETWLSERLADNAAFKIDQRFGYGVMLRDYAKDLWSAWNHRQNKDLMEQLQYKVHAESSENQITEAFLSPEFLDEYYELIIDPQSHDYLAQQVCASALGLLQLQVAYHYMPLR